MRTSFGRRQEHWWRSCQGIPPCQILSCHPMVNLTELFFMFDYWKVFSVIALSLSYSIPSWAFSWIFDLLTSHDLSCPQSVRSEDDQFKIMPILKLYLLLVESNKNPFHIKKLFFFSFAGIVVVSWVFDWLKVSFNNESIFDMYCRGLLLIIDSIC